MSENDQTLYRRFTLLRDADSRHGGKAKGLRALIRAGLTVPQGIALDDQQVARLLTRDPADVAVLDEWLRQRPTRVAVRSSALNEDGHEQSFAGMFKTSLEVPSVLSDVLKAIDVVAGSGGSERVASYSGARSDTIPIIIQDMVDAWISGIAFSRALMADGSDAAYVEWVHGAGEQLVSGQVAPASLAIAWDAETGRFDLANMRIHKELPPPLALNPILEMLEWLAGSAKTAWDIEWSVDRNCTAFALQLRPISRDVLVPANQRLDRPVAASPGVATGLARVVDDDTHGQLGEGEVLVSRVTETDYVAAMTRASAIVTEEGGLLSHAAIIARELGKPCVVGVRAVTSLIQPGYSVCVDGNLGAVEQGKLSLGGLGVADIDWTSVYIYDRGVEFDVDGTLIYVEPTLDYLMVHVDEPPSGAASLAIEHFIRRRFHQAPRIINSDRRIWAREWRRFGQLHTVRAIEGLFSAAIASWDMARIDQAIAVLQRSAERLGEASPSDPIDRLFVGECGAALHALVSTIIEGEASWSAFRDTADWREANGITYSGMLAERDRYCTSSAVANIIGVLDKLAKFRNGAYDFFRRVGAFDGDYFGGRVALVKAACETMGCDFEDEDRSLSAIYQTKEWTDRDGDFYREIAGDLQAAISGSFT